MSSSIFQQRMESEYRNDTAPWETGQPCSEIQRRLAAGDLPRSGTEAELRNELGRDFEITDLRTFRLDKPVGFEREPLFWSVLLRRN